MPQETYRLFETEDDRCDLSVLVRVVEETDDTDGIDGGLVTTVVGLHSFDECYDLAGHPGDGRVESVPRIIVIDHEAAIWPPVPDWSGLDGEGSLTSVLLVGHGDSDVVEGGAHVMHSVPDQEGEFRLRLLSEPNDVHPQVALTFGLLSSLGAVRAHMGVTGDLTVELLEVLLRPIELEPPRFSHSLPSEEILRRSRRRTHMLVVSTKVTRDRNHTIPVPIVLRSRLLFGAVTGRRCAHTQILEQVG